MNKKNLFILPLMLGLLLSSCTTSGGGSDPSIDPARSAETVFYTVTFVNYDNSFLYSTTVRSGADAVFDAPTPTRDSDEEISYYRFVGWDKPLTAVTANTTFVAQYSKEYYKVYYVDFVNYDGTPLYSTTVRSGESAFYVGDVPTRPNDDYGIDYVFTGWNKSTANITSDSTFIATYVSKANVFTVTFRNYDDSLLDVEYVEDGGTVVYNGVEPTKPSSNGISYKFSGWDNSLTDVRSSMTIRPIYTSDAQTFVVTFQNYNGDVLYISEVEAGGDAFYDGETPTKEPEGEYDFAFTGWDKEFTDVQSNLLVTAKFQKVERDYSTSLGFALQSDNTYSVVSNYDYSAKTILIPKTYSGLRVKSVGENVFRYNNNIETVKFENGGVAYIGNSAFSSCSNLKTVIFPNTLKTIGDYAFDYTAIKELSIPANVTTLSSRSFRGCNSLETIKISENNPYIISEGGIIYNKKKTIIQDFFFLKNGSANIEIPEGVEKIEKEIFRDEDGNSQRLRINSISFPSTLKEIGNNSFYSLDGLTKVVFNDSPCEIKEWCFRECYELKDIDLGNKMLSIGDNSFYGCCAKTIHFPKTITRMPISNWDFFYDNQLEEVTIDEENPYYKAFDGVLYDSSFNNYVIVPRGKKGTLTIPKEYSNTYLNNFVQQCNNVTEIKIEEGSVYLWADDNAIFSYDKTTLCLVTNKQLTSYEIPNTVTSIRGNAMTSLRSLKSVTIPESVTQMDGAVLNDCTNLSSVDFKAKVDRIPSSMFSGCTSLTSFEIPESVTGIDGWAFSSSGIKIIEIPDSVNYIDGYVFSECNSLKSVKLPNSITSIRYYTFRNCTSLKTIEIPESVTYIEYNAFDNSGLTSIVIPKTVTSMDNNAFSNCPSLKFVDIQAGITYISSNTFSNCQSLTDVVIPVSVNRIESNAFQNCASLKNVYYLGTQAQWASVTNYDSAIYNACINNLYFYSKTEKTEGKYWRYVDGIPTVWEVKQ